MENCEIGRDLEMDEDMLPLRSKWWWNAQNGGEGHRIASEIWATKGNGTEVNWYTTLHIPAKLLHDYYYYYCP